MIRINIIEIFYNIIVENENLNTIAFTTNLFELIFNYMNKITFQDVEHVYLFREVGTKFMKKMVLFNSIS